MESLQQTAARVLGPLLSAQPLSPGKVAFAWALAAGPALGRAGIPTWTPDGTLRIRARDAAWRTEIERARPMVAERLAHLLGPGAIRRIIVTESSHA
ncbi:MAG: DUF721 domain-containing protein [Acidobacteria bacterium]|nr:DUF721 domain-containing protein [Acidobacteriota bacterium]